MAMKYYLIVVRSIVKSYTLLILLNVSAAALIAMTITTVHGSVVRQLLAVTLTLTIVSGAQLVYYSMSAKLPEPGGSPTLKQLAMTVYLLSMAVAAGMMFIALVVMIVSLLFAQIAVVFGVVDVVDGRAPISIVTSKLMVWCLTSGVCTLAYWTSVLAMREKIMPRPSSA